MSRLIERAVLIAGIAAAMAASAAPTFPGIGRTATPDELNAWNIDVRPDFEGLPKGSGTVARGQEIWDGKCASCHGTFGESNEVFTPIVGGTTRADMQTGRVAALTTGTATHRTTLMKLSTLSTLWDYIRRAMPWNAPKSLSNDDVYAVVAYILNLGEIVADDFTLSDANIREVQNRLPNRNGMTREHGLWDLKAKPDVRSAACMSHCATEVKLISALPDFARGSHGNLALQNREYGPVRGVNTTLVAIAGGSPRTALLQPGMDHKSAATEKDLASKAGCLACHGISNKVVGPAFTEVAAKYHGDDRAETKLIAKLETGGQGAWGTIPMPPQKHVPQQEIKSLVHWILDGAQ